MDTASPEVLRTPRAAGIAGVIAAVMLAATMILVRQAIPHHPVSAATWLADSGSRNALEFSLFLLPFGAIAFLWFMGAVRDFVGGREDRFYATVFLGSGLLYVAMLLVYGTLAGAFVLTIDKMNNPSQQPDLWHFGRYLTLSLLTEYAPRMAGVFTLTATTIGTRLGLLPRWLSLLGYLVGLVLLLIVSSLTWSEIVFPVWVLIISIFLITHQVRRIPDPVG